MQISQNRKALFEYQILETFEAGLVLHGEEIKAVRLRKISIQGSYIKPLNQKNSLELWWIGPTFTLSSGVSQRTIKVLLKKSEVNRIIGKLSASNLTVIPLELYLTRGLAKIKIALASKKKSHDKRETLKKRAIEEELRISLKQKRRATE